jgi:hypothetical protein
MPIYNYHILYNTDTGNIKSSQTWPYEQVPAGFATVSVGTNKPNLQTQRYNVTTNQVENLPNADQIQVDQYKDAIRTHRNALLAQSDWTELPTNQARHDSVWITAWAEYRTQLREIMNTVPAVIDENYQPTWPIPPSQ